MNSAVVSMMLSPLIDSSVSKGDQEELLLELAYKQFYRVVKQGGLSPFAASVSLDNKYGSLSKEVEVSTGCLYGIWCSRRIQKQQESYCEIFNIPMESCDIRGRYDLLEIMWGIGRDGGILAVGLKKKFASGYYTYYGPDFCSYSREEAIKGLLLLGVTPEDLLFQLRCAIDGFIQKSKERLQTLREVEVHLDLARGVLDKL